MTSQDRFRKNQSMNSTHHMSCNQSYMTNGINQNRPYTSVLLSYAHIPMKKQNPRWNQSTATWRNTSHKYSFSKDNRFKDSPPYYTDIIQPQIPSTLKSKTCTFGKGTRRPISLVVLRNAKQKPAPDRYDLSSVDEQTRSEQKGKTFGLGWKAYERNFIKQRQDVYAEFQTQHNPPAHYNVRETPGQTQHKFTAYGRLKMYSQKMADSKSHVPGPYHKVRDRHLYGTTGFNERNFSFGQRIDFSKPANDNPQAIYHIPDLQRKLGNDDFHQLYQPQQNNKIIDISMKPQNIQKNINLVYEEHHKSTINYADALKQLKYAQKELQLKKKQIKVANLKVNRGSWIQQQQQLRAQQLRQVRQSNNKVINKFNQMKNRQIETINQLRKRSQEERIQGIKRRSLSRLQVLEFKVRINKEIKEKSSEHTERLSKMKKQVIERKRQNYRQLYGSRKQSRAKYEQFKTSRIKYIRESKSRDINTFLEKLKQKKQEIATLQHSFTLSSRVLEQKQESTADKRKPSYFNIKVYSSIPKNHKKILSTSHLK